MTDITVFTGTALIPGWRWHTAREGLLPPAEMETRHLFNTLRMIWNNFMPPSMRVGAVRLYRFDPRTHPRRYLGEAILQIGRELFTRPDITPGMQIQLEQMAAFLRRHARITTTVVLEHSVPETFSLGSHDQI